MGSAVPSPAATASGSAPRSAGPPHEDAMLAEERDLADDAQWKRIQQNTFTRWANEHLKPRNRRINSLETDLQDGLNLIALIEELSGKRMPRHSRQPTFRSQKLENVSVALRFLERDEHIKIVNIDSTHIVDCQLKLILGLIWTLILHYSISIPMWEGDNGLDEADDRPEPAPRVRLMNWVGSKMPGLPVKNFTSDWRDGKAIGALVDGVAPGLCPDWSNWRSEDALRNASEAMGLADDWLNVPQLIRPEDMINPNVDELSMMTYLSQYPNAKLKPGAPLRSKTNPDRVRCYGPGVEPSGPAVSVPTTFTVETFAAGQGKVECDLIRPDGRIEPIETKFSGDATMTYRCSYTPSCEGRHQVSVLFAGRPVPRSPFPVTVEGPAGDPNKVTASGPGLRPTGVVAGKPTYFDLFTKDAGRGSPEVMVLDSQGKSLPPSQLSLRPVADGRWRCDFTAPQSGLHSVNVLFDRRPIAGSPFPVKVGPACDPRRVRVTGRGLQSHGVRVGDTADVRVWTDGAGDGQPQLRVVAPGGTTDTVPLRKVADSVYEGEFYPTREGRYIAMISYGGQEIPKSPFEVNVGPMKESAINCFGPGLRGGVAGAPAVFTVDTGGETGALGFSIEGPSQAAIQCRDNGDGSADVSYFPTAPGEYAVHVLCEGEDIPQSPWMARISPPVHGDPTKVKVTGVQSEGVTAGQPSQFSIDTRQAGGAPPQLTIMDEQFQTVPARLTEKTPGVFRADFTPNIGGKQTIQVEYSGVAVPGSPFRVQAADRLDASMVRLFGPALEPGVKAQLPTHFNVDAHGAGQGELQAVMREDRSGTEVPVRITDHGDGTLRGELTYPRQGTYTLHAQFGGRPVPQSPVRVTVQPGVNVSQIRVEGLEPTVPLMSRQQFVVRTPAGLSPADLAVTVTSPSGVRTRANIRPTPAGLLVDFVPLELGLYWLGVRLAGAELTGRRVACVPAAARSVRVHGPGLTGGGVRQPQRFVIDTRGAGQGGLGVTVEGPCEAAINCRDNGDGTCDVAYLPTAPGLYLVNVCFNDEHVPGSPFRATVHPEHASPAPVREHVREHAEHVREHAEHVRGHAEHVRHAERNVHAQHGHDARSGAARPDGRRQRAGRGLEDVRTTGYGVHPYGVFVDSPADVTLDARSVAGCEEGRVTCLITNPSGDTTPSYVESGRDGTFQISYTPFEEGRHEIEIAYNGVQVPGSPFFVHVRRGCEPSRVTATGPGLRAATVNKPNSFTVNTRGAGTGGLGLAIEGPSEAKMSCVDNLDGSCLVQYIPTEPGEYDVNIKFAEQHIPGSPFKVPVVCEVDAGAVIAHGPGVTADSCRANVPMSFTVDATRSAPAELRVDVRSDRGPLPRRPSVKDNRDGTYEVTYEPPPEGSICIPRVTWGGVDIPGSPWRLPVRPTCEPFRVRLSGPGVSGRGLPASLPTQFTIDTRQAGFGDLEAQVMGPDQQPRTVEIIDNEDGTFTGWYTPDDCGQYRVAVRYGGRPVATAAVPVQVVPSGQADRCRVEQGDLRDQVISVGEEQCITVDAKRAGTGNITCRVRSASGSSCADVDVEDNRDGTYKVYFRVDKPGEYVLNIKFGGETIPDGLYTFTAQAEVPVTASRTQQLNAYNSLRSPVPEQRSFRPVELSGIPLPSSGGRVTAEVVMPSGNKDAVVVQDNRDGTVSVKYEPKEEGVHELNVKYNGEHVQGSPFKFHVDSISSGYVTAYGPGLIYGITGEPANFTVSTKDAGSGSATSRGGLALAVEGPSKTDINCHDNKDGTVSVSYLPTSPGIYHVSVKFADKDIKGSPFPVKVTGEGRKRNQVSMGGQSEVTLPGKVTEKDIKLLNALITAPSGLEEPCFLKKLDKDQLGISFTPREIGQHLVAVKKKGTEIAGSPFKIMVSPHDVGDALKVKVEGSALTSGKTHQQNKFTIDTKSAGYGGVSLSMEGPSKAEIKCDDKGDGKLEVSYNPKEPGFYIINLKFADHHVKGSPFTCKVTGEGSNTQTERIKRDRAAAPLTAVGTDCALTFKMPGVSALELSASVASPGGVVEDASISELEDSLHAVKFVPKELGVHTVSVRYRDVHIPGSPFQFTVGPLKDGGAHRVHAGGPGLERGEQGCPCEFNVWTREAGAGSLAVSVEGPSKAEIDFKDRQDGSCYISYVVSEPGEYRVGIKFNDSHIPDSPYKVFVSPANKDAHKVTVGQLPDAGVQVDKPIIFTVDRTGCKGQMDCKVVNPSGHEDDCFITYLDDDTYSVRFLPKENGIHQLHVKWNSVHVPGSPFRLKIGRQDADPAAVHAHGKGLEKGHTGHKSDFIIDTCSAGAGTLGVTIDGPSKVAMDCTEVDEGYKVRYTPLNPGHYYVAIKYDGYHIVGSPFKVEVTGDELAEMGPKEQSTVVVETIAKQRKGQQEKHVVSLPKFDSDASKVQSKGMGLKKAYLNRQNQFQIDAGTAGQDILWVGCFGPKNPCEEVHIKHMGRNQYQVHYTVKERGKHILAVRWGADNIPGSPFEIEV
ncbi:filamin-A-like isoform X2 [Amphibalanus amphitrite]|uniref:filamin-A-like isoform X2 n=1 Tax=Amphibalanus amphitrite TaxID=1232801 RepID=UPI001C912432|nr:filamin-A-like isoform X2 [Amphibalanus amphitrite]